MRDDGSAKILTNVRTFQDCEIPGIVAQLITNIPLMKGTVPKRLDICYDFGTPSTFITFTYCSNKCHAACEVF